MAAMRLCLLVFCLSLAIAANLRQLASIKSLKNTGYANQPPRYGLQLLFWLANNVYFEENNNNMHFRFIPHDLAFGFHLFRNDPPLLPPLSSGQSYYTVGNLNTRQHPLSRHLPSYVREHHRDSPETNMDRIIVSLDQNHSNRIYRVFVTRHYDSFETYEIAPALILQIQNGMNRRQNEDENCLRFLQQTGYLGSCPGFSPRKKRSLDDQCEAFTLQIKTTTDGNSKLIWMNIPDNIFQTYSVYAEICQNTYSSYTDAYPTPAVKQSDQIYKSNGSLEMVYSPVLLNAGLQPRLRLSSFISSDRFWYGPEVDGGPLVRIKGFDADLQLWQVNGKACARFYIKKTFSNWKSFDSSWVGFYRHLNDKSENYAAYSYVFKFSKVDQPATDDYDIYQYDSSLTIAPGVQIRFFAKKTFDVLIQTTPWERDEEETSVWTFPEFFNEPEFYDANNVVPIKIDKHDAGLQLFTKDGKACARLYIKKTFKNWRDTFYYSWVGFYKSSNKANDDYYKFEYAVKFTKQVGDNPNFDIYQHKSELPIEPGVQIRFHVDTLSIKTEPWKSG